MTGIQGERRAERISQDSSTALSVDRARVLARALDSAVRIPGTNVRFGLDALLGLVPGLGDVAGAAMGSYIVLLGSRLGAPKPVLARMVLNVALDTLVGVVPVAGDLFDVAWKANTRNMALLERYIDRPAATRRSSSAFVSAIIAALALLAVGGIMLAVVVVRWLFGALS
ncbi:MAG: DUF4112 domain-containing protein [Gemmatimonadaceae bacterium]|nr:DUF4112 domain-containing protein [Gemmatimonadaceae bacterium]